MIPVLVPREQLVAANGLFTLTLNGAFALGYALLGPLIVTIAGGPEPLIVIVAVLFGLAAVFCVTLPSDPPVPQRARVRTRRRHRRASRRRARRSPACSASCARASATSATTRPSPGRWRTSGSPRR